MIINNVTLESVTVGKAGFPTTGLPELALCGRSNVGKSSFINAMTGRKSLARTSQSPGKTRTINFYNIENKLYFVDLPGYGYSKASKSESQSWGRMIEGYLKNRAQLKAAVLLMDIRRTPSDNDLLMASFLRNSGCHIIVAVTKADKVARGKQQPSAAAIQAGLGLTTAAVPFSSVSKQGRDPLWEIIQETLSISI